MKVDREFSRSSFSDPRTLESYTRAVEEIGLWESEKVFFRRHLPVEGRVLDVGCGAGRTTFGLHRLGYSRIQGLDLSEGMISRARAHAERLGAPLAFQVGDACCLPFAPRSFDACLFSFNGLMQVPRREDRRRVFAEVRRVLAPGGKFVFTTHERSQSGPFREFWKEEADRWRAGRQDESLHEFGDRIVEVDGRSFFIHIPDRPEVLGCLEDAGLERIEDAWRADLAQEREEVTRMSAECRFWASRRPAPR